MLVRDIFQTNSSSSCQIYFHRRSKLKHVSSDFIKKLKEFGAAIPELDKMKPACTGERNPYTQEYTNENIAEDLLNCLDEGDLNLVKGLLYQGFEAAYHMEYLGYHRGGHGILFNHNCTEGVLLTQASGDCGHEPQE